MEYKGKGGWRGGGRPKLPIEEKKVFKRLSIAGTEKEIESIKNLAKESEKTVSRFVIDSILEEVKECEK